MERLHTSRLLVNCLMKRCAINLKPFDLLFIDLPYWSKKSREQKVAKSRNVFKNNWNKKSQEQKVAELKVAWN